MSLQGPATVVRPDQFMQSMSSSALRTLSANGGRMSSLRTLSTLRKDEWEQLDTAIVDVARQRLNGIMDLKNAGLVHNLGSVGITLSEYERVSDMNDASVDMAGVTRGQLDNIDYELESIPVPVVHKEFDLNWRRRIASANGIGEGLDVTMPATASRKVSDKLEDILFNGASGIKVNGKSILGYTTATNRNTGTISNAWDGTATGEQILADVLEMISKAHADNMFGPFVLYVNGTYWPFLFEDFKTNSDKTVMQRLLEIPSISAIKPADVLSATEVVMVQMTRDVVDLAIAEDIQTIDWESMGGRVNHFSVFAVMVPRIKEDYDGRSGIVHYSE